ncbi:MAG: hypothetical protein VYA84_15585 [Planctomycetota bacterium]|nr:hypothetical protein [Planctomycetota bacterium]
MTETPNAVVAKGGQMAIRRSSAILAPDHRKKMPECEVGNENPRPRTRKRRKLIRRIIAIACLGGLVGDTTGCTLTRGTVHALRNSDCVEEFMIGYRNRAMAEKAWHCRKHRFGNQPHGHEYKEGFIDGYIEIATGGLGCCPKIAPSRYWGWKYQSATGRQAVNAWFEGYPMGVQAAEQEGIGNWGRIQTMGVPTAGGVGSSCNSCGSGVVDPLNGMPEMIPEEMPEGVIDPGGKENEMVVPPTPDSVFNAPVRREARPTKPESIASREISSEMGLIDTQSMEIGSDSVKGSNANESQLFPSAPASDQLPFTFE